MATQKLKHRNAIMAKVAHQDPARFRSRTVETETEKQTKSRARRKAQLRKAMKDDCD